jgi:predicted flap endonuclease-1-like 5' DNA nuclease
MDQLSSLTPRNLDEAVTAMKAATGAPSPVRDQGEDDDTAFDLVPRLAPHDDIVDAPSIGPKTADRLRKVGINTVAELMAADPGALSEQIDVRHITARTIRDWQYQAGLVMTIPDISGTDAQLLVGAGYPRAARVGEASADDLYAAVTDFAKSSDGERVLRSGKRPDMDKVKGWIERAQRIRRAA